ncbi:hypothetical protein [Myxococcus xanthus]|uniref:hypothetical protein n=1 Tax=Myxococcus xanthus TaxID=34 RepID=UPI001128C57F|nr:hypothetical protein [Myxococcus xanthus]
MRLNGDEAHIAGAAFYEISERGIITKDKSLDAKPPPVNAPAKPDGTYDDVEAEGYEGRGLK